MFPYLERLRKSDKKLDIEFALGYNREIAIELLKDPKRS
jgi:hypothetical protein